MINLPQPQQFDISLEIKLENSEAMQEEAEYLYVVA